MRGLAAPDAQARLDPRARVEPRKLDGRRRLFEKIRDAHRLKAIVGLELAVEASEEVVPVVRVLLPRVLTVEDDRREVGPALIRKPIARTLELRDHVGDRVLGFHVAVEEADAVGQLAVAKDHRRPVREAVRPV